jgi:hypothetical protein
MEKARLIDAKGSVQDIAFAPNFWGLRLVRYFNSICPYIVY